MEGKQRLRQKYKEPCTFNKSLIFLGRVSAEWIVRRLTRCYPKTTQRARDLSFVN